MAHHGLRQTYKGLVYTENFIGQIFLLVIRVYWGYLLFRIGLTKLTNIPETAQFFATLGIPMPGVSAVLAGLIELIGGASLVLGLFSRVMSLILVAHFIIACLAAHTEAIVNFFSNPNVFFEAPPFLFFLTSLIVLCFGPGFISFDYWIEKVKFGKKL